MEFIRLPEDMVASVCMLLDVCSLCRLAATSKRCGPGVERSARLRLPSALKKQYAELARILQHPAGQQCSFRVYAGFLQALQNMPLQDPLSAQHRLGSYRSRLLYAALPRPRREGSLGNPLDATAVTNWNYGFRGFYGDLFGTGNKNDFLRTVNGALWHMGQDGFWALAVAGSDGSQYVRVEEKFARDAQNALSQNGDVVDWSTEQGLQYRVNTKYDRLFRLWYAVGNAYQNIPN